MLIGSQTTTLLQIFCEPSLYSQVIFKSMRVADDTFQWGLTIFLLGMYLMPYYNEKLSLLRNLLFLVDFVIKKGNIDV